ncbi:MAG: glycosyltransferase, partial [Bryobacteraceae bacterium]
SDRVVCSSEYLARQIGREAVVIRNGVDADRFAIQPIAPPRAGAKTIGYAGALDFWFDAESVRQAAERHPEWRFLLIGRVEDERAGALAKLANVELMGEVAWNELPALMARMDVGLIPFLPMPLTEAANPIKLYEYFACGMPVVSTRLPEVERMAGLAYIAGDGEDFVRQVEVAAAEWDPELRRRRRALAEKESWETRCRALLSVISPTHSATC